MYVEQMKTSKDFYNLLNERGCSPKAIKELWKWYDYSEKKGVASF
jgi:hypothetical protein